MSSVAKTSFPQPAAATPAAASLVLAQFAAGLSLAREANGGPSQIGCGVSEKKFLLKRP